MVNKCRCRFLNLFVCTCKKKMFLQVSQKQNKYWIQTSFHQVVCHGESLSAFNIHSVSEKIEGTLSSYMVNKYCSLLIFSRAQPSGAWLVKSVWCMCVCGQGLSPGFEKFLDSFLSLGSEVVEWTPHDWNFFKFISEFRINSCGMDTPRLEKFLNTFLSSGLKVVEWTPQFWHLVAILEILLLHVLSNDACKFAINLFPHQQTAIWKC